MNRTEYWQKCLKILKKEFESRGITRCEVCGKDNFLSFAHLHKRRWYYGQEELLKDFNQVLLLCVPDHQLLEYNEELTKETFQRLRG